MSDARIVYGATCSWWGSISDTAPTRAGLPGCPICRGVLLETSDESRWWAGVDAYEAQGHPGYRGFIEWLRGRCYRGLGFLNYARGVYDTENDETIVRVAEAAAVSFDKGRPGLSPNTHLDISAARQLVSHLVESTAIHSRSRGWIPSIAVTLHHVPLGDSSGPAETVQFVLVLDEAQTLIDVLIDGLEHAIADSEYGLREA